MYKMKRSATLSLITIICAAYLVDQLYPQFYEYTALFGPLVQSGEVWRLFTVALVHGGLTHLFFNMFSLLVLGNPVEATLGKARFLIIFFVSLLTGSLSSVYLSSYPYISVGASGAVFGLFGAFIAMRKMIREGVRDIYLIIGLNFIFGFILGGVDWRAHLGGLVGGYLTTTVLLRITRV
jgi:membrane associated rhomboid family serine protease